MSDVPSDLPIPDAKVRPSLEAFSDSFWRLFSAVADTARDGAKSVAQRAEIEFTRNLQTALLFGETIPFINPIEYEPIRKPDAYLGLRGFEEKKLYGRRDNHIAVWHKEASDASKPLYVVFHGRRGHWGDVGYHPKADSSKQYDRHYRIEWLKSLAATGAEVIAVHMSGQGASRKYGGKPGEASFAQDVKTLADYVEQRRIDPAGVVLTGESLGGAVATMLAVEMTRRGRAPEGLALINSFSSMRECVVDLFKHIPEPSITRALRHKFESQQRLSALDPTRTFLYLAHAPEDKIVPFTHRHRLQEAALSQQMQVETRDLTDDYLHKHFIGAHTGWNAIKVVADIEKLYHTRRNPAQSAMAR